MVEKAILISCAKTKRSTPSAAKDLYQYDLFRSMRCYAENNADTRYILSAKHGVLHPDTIIDPYEKTLNQMTKPERLTWTGKPYETKARKEVERFRAVRDRLFGVTKLEMDMSAAESVSVDSKK